MRALIVSCSLQAWQLGLRLQKRWLQEEPDARLELMVKCSALPELSEKEPLKDAVGARFDRVDAIVFLCAAGIAVRAVAPWLGHKSADPAVVVLDETAAFCISLLSGHAGGANELAERLAEMTGAVPVITTASDREGKFSADVFARKNGLIVADWTAAKEISARILRGEPVGFLSQLPIEGQLPPELVAVAEEEGGAALPAGILISPRRLQTQPFSRTLQLIPRTVAAGIGCRKGTGAEKIEAALAACLAENGIRPETLFAVASVDLKAAEEGLIACCEKRGLPFLTFSAQRLREVEGDFTASAFVERTAGVDNVCERSAMAAAGGRLLCKKTIYDGVTVALAERKGRVTF